MTNYEHNLMVTAINEYSNIGYDIKDLDEATDCLTYDEILDCFVSYYQSEYGTISYKIVKYYIEEFYWITHKTVDDLNIY